MTERDVYIIVHVSRGIIYSVEAYDSISEAQTRFLEMLQDMDWEDDDAGLYDREGNVVDSMKSYENDPKMPWGFHEDELGMELS